MTEKQTKYKLLLNYFPRSFPLSDDAPFGSGISDKSLTNQANKQDINDLNIEDPNGPRQVLNKPSITTDKQIKSTFYTILCCPLGVLEQSFQLCSIMLSGIFRPFREFVEEWIEISRSNLNTRLLRENVLKKPLGNPLNKFCLNLWRLFWTFGD